MALRYDILAETSKRPEKIFEQVVEAFKTHHITPNPVNFAAFYTYFNGNVPQLNRELDAILSDKYGYQERYGKELFEKYLQEEDHLLAELDRAIRHLLSSLAKRIEQMAQHFEKQSQTLEAVSTQLTGPIDQTQLSALTESVLKTAQELKDDTSQFEHVILSSAQEIQRLRKELIEARMESMKDELTGLLNRRAFNETLTELTVMYEDKPDQLHLIMTDIDHFKNFNDTFFGHLTGDSVLRYFAKLMLNTKRDNEDVFRYGGEEFAIVTRDESLEDAKARMGQLRKELTKARLKRRKDNTYLPTITASFGIGEFKGADDSIEAFIERADKALYLAKKCGRNQVKTEFDQGCED